MKQRIAETVHEIMGIVHYTESVHGWEEGYFTLASYLAEFMTAAEELQDENTKAYAQAVADRLSQECQKMEDGR